MDSIKIKLWMIRHYISNWLGLITKHLAIQQQNQSQNSELKCLLCVTYWRWTTPIGCLLFWGKVWSFCVSTDTQIVKEYLNHTKTRLHVIIYDQRHKGLSDTDDFDNNRIQNGNEFTYRKLITERARLCLREATTRRYLAQLSVSGFLRWLRLKLSIS